MVRICEPGSSIEVTASLFVSVVDGISKDDTEDLGSGLGLRVPSVT